MSPDPLNDDTGLEGRHLRAALGGLVIVASVVVFVLHAYKGHDISLTDIGLHGALLVTGLLLIDPTSAREVLARIGEWLPWRRGA